MDRIALTARVAEVMAILRDANVPEPLMPTVFGLLWSGEASRGGEMPTVVLSSPSGPLAALSTRVGIEEGSLRDLFAVSDDGSLVVRVPARQLAPAKTKATIELGLLVCAARQAGGESATPTRVVRQLCDEYGRLDGPNFATTLKAGDRYWQLSGKGAEALLTLRRPGWEEAGSLMKRLLGE